MLLNVKWFPIRQIVQQCVWCPVRHRKSQFFSFLLKLHCFQQLPHHQCYVTLSINKYQPLQSDTLVTGIKNNNHIKDKECSVHHFHPPYLTMPMSLYAHFLLYSFFNKKKTIESNFKIIKLISIKCVMEFIKLKRMQICPSIVLRIRLAHAI